MNTIHVTVGKILEEKSTHLWLEKQCVTFGPCLCVCTNDRGSKRECIL